MPLDFAPGEVTRQNVLEAFWLGVMTGVVSGVMAIAFFEAFTGALI